ncbi:SDR family NAD(P)-dependent oxidoreductase [Mycobacterium sp. PS03-16]|uniref:mycobactin polyketide synthase MbtD n=1 Tax=Mycobacterium sp. PS03-16 TaxID=2559611 RepID=UPI001072F8DF|nr:mycobactin polyketide synthase MbtD [Mycobacterium sp. PS03-16]TFV58415.1 SDR family NAD(P)-dependent oxidoreductase [Mycobacterium sp. PS03-16]
MPALRWPDGRVPVLLSGHAEDLLAVDAAALLDHLRRRRPAVAELAAHLARTRRVRRHRAVVRAHDLDELTDGLRALTAGAEHPLLTRVTERAQSRTAFVCPGQGSQWPAMGADAYRLLPAYRVAADAAAAGFDAAGLTSPLRYLTTDAVPDTFGEIEVQGAQFVHTVALGAVWREAGILPDVTIGHSLGEIAAAYLAETITLAEAVAVVAARAGVVDHLTGSYAVAALGITAADAENLIAATPGWLELSVINAQASVAVSGDRDAVTAAVAAVQGRGGFAREITVNFPVHTSVLDPLRRHVENRLPRGAFTDSPVQFIGAVTGDVVTAGTGFADYWYANLRRPVRFDRAVAAAIRCGVGTFVELSTHPALLHAIGDGLGATPALLVGSGRRGVPVTDQLAAGIAAAALTDPRYRWRDLHDPTAPVLSDIPPAPMRKIHLWAAPDPLPPADGLTVAAETWHGAPLPGAPTAPQRIAVVGPDDALTAALRAAVDGHASASRSAATDADIVVVAAPALDQTGVADAAAGIADGLDDGLLDYTGLVGPACRQVWLVTVAGERVVPADPVARPAQAALAAMHRAFGFEHPDQGFGHLDVSARTLDAASATAAVDAVLAGAGEVALRGGTVYRRAIGDPVPAAPAWPLDSGVLDEVVITGGAGAIGLQYAHYLAERGARRIVLLSRRRADPDTLAGLRDRFGTDIVAVPCDLTDRAGLAAAAGHTRGGASLLVHAAGAASFQTRDRLDGTVFTATCAAKVTGLAHLLDTWPIREDARILLCSSVIGVWGGSGTAAYAAANRMLDVAADRLRAEGRRAVSVRWGLWDTADGRPGIIDAAETQRVRRSGLRPMAPRAAIEAGLFDFGVDPLILSADPERLGVFFGAQQAVAPAAAPRDSAPATDPADAVRTELAAVLNAPDAAMLDLETSLFDLGVDSLLALDLRKRLQRSTGTTVKLARLLSGITAAELIADLSAHDTKVDTPSD